MTWHLPHFCGFRLTRRDAVTRCRFIRVDIHRGKKKKKFRLSLFNNGGRWCHNGAAALDIHYASALHNIINIQSNEGKSLSSAAASSHVPDGRTRLCVAVCYYYFQHLYALAAFTSPCLARRKPLHRLVFHSAYFSGKNQRNRRGEKRYDEWWRRLRQMVIFDLFDSFFGLVV